MNHIGINTPEQLHAWLKEHGYFVACYCPSARRTAEEHPPEYAEHLDKPEFVTIELAYQLGGGWTAGESRVMRVFRCTGRRAGMDARSSRDHLLPRKMAPHTKRCTKPDRCAIPFFDCIACSCPRPEGGAPDGVATRRRRPA